MCEWQNARQNLPAYHQTVCIELVTGKTVDFCFYTPYLWHCHDKPGCYRREEVARWRCHTVAEKEQRNMKRFEGD